MYLFMISNWDKTSKTEVIFRKNQNCYSDKSGPWWCLQTYKPIDY